jgi:methanogenic corrinoid protein MtbC1
LVGNLSDLQRELVGLNGENALRLVREALVGGVDPSSLVEEEIIPAVEVVGEKFDRHEYFLPQLLICGDIVQEAMKLIKPYMAESDERFGIVVIGTIEGDVHSIGKNVVASFLTASGFEVYDLGTDVSPKTFIDRAEERGADFICISALMHTTRTGQADLIDFLEGIGKREKFKVIVGGGATSNEWAENIRADGWSLTAPGAVDLLKNMWRKTR